MSFFFVKVNVLLEFQLIINPNLNLFQVCDLVLLYVDFLHSILQSQVPHID